MSKPLPSQVTFSGLAPPWSLVNLDANLTNLWNAIDDLGTYSNYFLDTGAVNSLTVTVTGPLTFALVDGVILQIKVGNTTTSTAPTLNVASTGAKTIVHADGTALIVGELVAAMRITVIYDSAGALWRLQSPTFNPGGTFTAPIVVNATASQVSLTVNGAANQYAEKIVASSTSGQSLGLQILGGTTSADIALLVQNQAATAIFLALSGDGHGTLGPSASLGLSWTGSGNMTTAAPASGVGLTITSSADGNPALKVLGAATGVSAVIDSTNANGVYETFTVSGTAIMDMGSRKQTSGSGAAADGGIAVRGSNAFSIATNNIERLLISNAAPIVQGYGPIAAALVDMTPDKGSFTGTLTGVSAGGTGTVNWIRMGNVVVMYVTADLTGTSNAATLTMTGIPAAVQPAHTQVVVCSNMDDAGGTTKNWAEVSISGGTATFSRSQVTGGIVQSNASGWSAGAGTKGMAAGWTIAYQLQ